jgi:DNA-binding NarL/FixJ family response regulator
VAYHLLCHLPWIVDEPNEAARIAALALRLPDETIDGGIAHAAASFATSDVLEAITDELCEDVAAARAVLERAGATSELARFERRSGRRSTRTASSALSAREERVARMIAGGASTGDVAAAIGLAPRTIEGHLSKIYAKLGVRSRIELVGFFADRDRTTRR